MPVCMARPDDDYDHNNALLAVLPTRAHGDGRRPRTRSPRSYQASVEPGEPSPDSSSNDDVDAVHHQVGLCYGSSARAFARIHVTHGSGPYPSGVCITGSKQLSHDGADAGVVPRREDDRRFNLRGERSSLSHVRVSCSLSFIHVLLSLTRPSLPFSLGPLLHCHVPPLLTSHPLARWLPLQSAPASGTFRATATRISSFTICGSTTAPHEGSWIISCCATSTWTASARGRTRGGRRGPQSALWTGIQRPNSWRRS
jgi:hypothetical protein